MRICQHLQNFYVGMVKNLFLVISKRWRFLSAVIATLMIEPFNTLRAGYHMQRGLKNTKFTNLNPKVLSQEQQKHNPVFFIHGDSSSSGIFDPMVNHMSQQAPHRPIFTIDLSSPDGIVSIQNHLNHLVAKVKEIDSLYATSSRPKISFVGHSSGGDVLGPLVKVMLEQKISLPGTLIKIGSVCKKHEAEEFASYTHGNVVEIVGEKDVFEGSHSHMPNHLVTGSGHVGLLFDEIVIKRVAKELTPSS